MNTFSNNTQARNCSSIFFSNTFTNLAKKLRQNLFLPSQDPLESRYVLVPSYATKNFLSDYFAKEENLGIFAGIYLLTLDEALTHFLKKLCPEEFLHIPSPIEFKLLIQDVLLRVYLHEEFKEVREYLGEKEEDHFSSKLEDLASELTYYYRHMSFYDEPAWEKIGDWKKKLLDFLSQDPSFCVDYKDLLNKLKPLEGVIHLFGFSILPPKFIDFFYHRKSLFYLFSPCSVFWEDFYSPKEKAFLKQKLPQRIAQSLEIFTEKEHPLLGLSGRQMQRFLQDLSDYEMEMDEDYMIKDPSFSCLSKLQYDLLEGEVSSRISLGKEDDTLSIHACPSKLREVEVLLDSLYAYSEKIEGFTAEDVVVISPNLSDYAAYIELVFDSDSSHFGYKLHQMGSSSSWVELFSRLTIFNGRYFLDRDQVLECFNLDAFQKKASFSKEEVQKLHKLIPDAGILWGFDKEHRKKVLIGVEDSLGTWQEGFRLLLRSFVKEEGDLYHLEITDMDLLERLIEKVRELHHTIESFFEGKKTISDWLLFFCEYLDTFLELSTQDREFCLSAQRLAYRMQKAQENLPFSNVKPILEELLSCQNRHTLYSEKPFRLDFYSLEDAPVLEKKVVCFLGFNEECLPFESLPSFLKEESLRYGHEKIYGKYFQFLKGIVLAKEALWISYTSFDVAHNPLDPHFLVQEVIKLVSPAVVKPHLAYGFENAYFSDSNSHYPSYSTSYYHLAQKLLEKKPQDEEKSSQERKLEPGVYTLVLKDFLFFMEDEERYFKHKVLGVFEEKEDLLPLFAKDFNLPYKKKEAIQKKASFQEEETKNEEFSSNIFKELTYYKLKKKQKTFEKQKKEDLFFVKLDPFCFQEVIVVDGFIVPEFTFTLDENIQIQFLGVLENLSPRGIILFEEKDKTAQKKASFLLALCYLNPHLKDKIPLEVHFVYSSKVQNWEEGDIKIFYHSLKEWVKLSGRRFYEEATVISSF